MNKTIKESSKNEIKQAMLNVKTLGYMKAHGLTECVNSITGELLTLNEFTIENAKQNDLALEMRLFNAKNVRNHRLYIKVKNIVESKKAIFVTLTFNDKFFARNMNDESIARIVKRYLKETCLEYVANIDFGGNNERMHYHAIVEPKGEKLNLDLWRDMTNGSNINVERIHVSKTSAMKTARYINKLTNHSLKENGYYKRLIFSRHVLKPTSDPNEVKLALPYKQHLDPFENANLDYYAYLERTRNKDYKNHKGEYINRPYLNSANAKGR